MTKKLAILTPLAEKDLDSFSFAFDSWKAYFPANWRTDYFVVVDDMSKSGLEILKEMSSDITIIQGDDLLPEELKNKKYWGWIRQQFYKLFFSLHTDHDYYLCMDSDTSITRPLKLDDFFTEDGRAKVYRWSSDMINKSNAEILDTSMEVLDSEFGTPNSNPFRNPENYKGIINLHREFVKSSQVVLGKALEFSEQYIFGAVMFDTSVVRSLLDYIKDLHGSYEQAFSIINQGSGGYNHSKLSEWTLYGNYVKEINKEKDVKIVDDAIVFDISFADHPVIVGYENFDFTKYAFVTAQSHAIRPVLRRQLAWRFSKPLNSFKTIGYMIVKDEVDVIEDYLGNISRYVDSLYVLDGSSDGTEKILKNHPLVKYYIRDEDLPKTVDGLEVFNKHNKISDGARHFLHEKAKELDPDAEWVILCHPDEFIFHDLHNTLVKAKVSKKTGVHGSGLFFYPHTSQADKWDSYKYLFEKFRWCQEPDEETFNYGQPIAFRFDKESSYKVDRHLWMWPTNNFEYTIYHEPDIKVGVFMFRTKQQFKSLIESHVKSEWSSSWVKNKNKFLRAQKNIDSHFFMDNIGQYIHLGSDTAKFKTPFLYRRRWLYKEFNFLRILNIGTERRDLSSLGNYAYYDGTGDLRKMLAEFNPNIIVSCDYVPDGFNVEFNYRKRWISVKSEESINSVADKATNCFSNNVYKKNIYEKDHPLISVYTGAHNSIGFIGEAYQSIIEQSYSNWEWVVVENGSTDGTYEYLLELEKREPRVRVVKIAPSGRIGEIKRTASQLCYGKYVVELDHDDFLRDDALEKVVAAFESDPEVGMVYSNDANFTPDGSEVRWDIGDTPSNNYWKGQYRYFDYKGKTWLETRCHDFYGGWGDGPYYRNAFFLTLGPDHIRAFRKETLFELGGYNDELRVADDWDLFTRFFIHSKVHQIDEPLYFYRYRDSGANETFVNNKDIQDLLGIARNHYYDAFKKEMESNSWKRR